MLLCEDTDYYWCPEQTVEKVVLLMVWLTVKKKCETNQQKKATHQQKPSKMANLVCSQWWDQHHGEHPSTPL